MLKRCEFLTGDRGYDDTRLIVKLWDDHSIKPVIDIRKTWRDGEGTKEERLVGSAVRIRWLRTGGYLRRWRDRVTSGRRSTTSGGRGKG